MEQTNIRIPVVYGGLYDELADDAAWDQQVQSFASAYEVETLARVPIQPGLETVLRVHTIGTGVDDRSLSIEIAPANPTVVERVAARGLLRALGSGSTDRQRMLHSCLLRIYVTEVVATQSSLAARPAPTGSGYGAAIASAVINIAGLWHGMSEHLSATQPDSLLSLRDVGGVGGLSGDDGFLTMVAHLPPELADQLERDLPNSFGRSWPGSAARRGYRRANRLLSAQREHAIASNLSTHLRFGGPRRRFAPVPDRLAEGELAVNYVRNLDQLRAAFGAGLVPVAPGLLFNVRRDRPDSSSAAFARWRLGSGGYSAHATVDDPARRANFLLAAAAALITAAASGKLG